MHYMFKMSNSQEKSWRSESCQHNTESGNQKVSNTGKHAMLIFFFSICFYQQIDIEIFLIATFTRVIDLTVLFLNNIIKIGSDIYSFS
jgi:hypothetical protein